MIVKIVNYTAGFNNLVSTLLVFGAYPRMHIIDLQIPTIIQKTTTIKKAIEQVRKIRAKNQVIDIFNISNRPIEDLIYNFLLNFDILV